LNGKEVKTFHGTYDILKKISTDYKGSYIAVMTELIPLSALPQEVAI